MRRYFVPLPESELIDSGLSKFRYYWKRDSLEFKLGKIISHFYSVYPTIETFAERCEIEIID
jgi:hypothetical protein